MIAVPLPENRQPTATHSADFTLSAADLGKIIILTPASDMTVTFPSASSLGDGFWCVLRNETAPTDGIKILLHADIDGSGSGGFHSLAREERFLFVAGSVFKSRVMRPFYLDIDWSDTYLSPSGYSEMLGRLWAGGGAGGKSGSASWGASGGGGGDSQPLDGHPWPAAGADLIVTISGPASPPAGAGTANSGGDSSIAATGIPTITAYRGGGGYGGTSAACGGGGGGALGPGIAGGPASSSTVGGAGSGGQPGLLSASAVNRCNPGFGGSSSFNPSNVYTSVGATNSAASGGGAGGSTTSSATTPMPGDSTVWGGPGGASAGTGGATENGGTCQRTGATGGHSSASGTAGSGSGYGAAGGATQTGTAGYGGIGHLWLSAR